MMPKSTPTNAIAARIRRTRETRGLDIKEFHGRLVEEAGLDTSYAAARNYDFDRVAPPEYLAAVNKLYGVSLKWLITGEGSVLEEDDRWDDRLSLRRLHALAADVADRIGALVPREGE